MPRTQHSDKETESASQRPFLWKGRSSRATQQQQQTQLLQLPEFASIGSSSDVSYINGGGYSDTNSIPSRTSSDHPSDFGNRMTRPELVDFQDFHDYFTQVPMDDPLLQDFQCSLRNDDFVRGQLFITKSFVCFKSNTPDPPSIMVEFKVENIKLIDLVRPGRWKPRMIQITLKNDAKYTFATFLPSTTARDEAYQCLMDIWQPPPPPPPPSFTLVAASSPPTPTALPSHWPPLPNTTITPEGDGSDTTTTTSDKPNNDLLTTTGPFKLFQRKRAQTSAAQTQQEQQRNRSVTSSSTPLTKSLNTHIIWNNDGQPQHIQPDEFDPPPTTSTQQPQQSILLNQKRKPSSSTKTPSSSPSTTTNTTSPLPASLAPQHQHPIARINTRTMLMIAGFLLLLSHVFLTYQFYHMTEVLTTRQLQQHQKYLHQQPQDMSWISDQLEMASQQVQRWEKETMQQRQRLMDMIPT